MGMPLVATSDVHYVNKEDAVAQDILLVHQHRQVPHRRQAHADGDQRVLSPQSGRDVRGLRPGHETPCGGAQEIADSVDIELELGKRHFPVYTPPAGRDFGAISSASCASRG